MVGIKWNYTEKIEQENASAGAGVSTGAGAGSEDVHLIYGIDIDQSNQSYKFYATNFGCVWVELLQTDDIIQRANSLGMEDVKKGGKFLNVLLETLDAEAGNPQSVSIKLGTDYVKLTMQSEDLHWNFMALKQDPSTANEVYVKLNFQLFTQLDFLLYRIRALEKLINGKDHYINFLSENYKAVNGDELIKRYSFGGQGNIVDKYNKIEFDRGIMDSYKSKKIWPTIVTSLKELTDKTDDEKKTHPPLRSISPTQQSSTFTISSTNVSKKKRRIGGMSIGNKRKRSPS